MIDSPGAGTYEFSDYAGVLRRRRWTIVAWTILGVLAAAAYLVAGPKTYTATASVYVTANAANSQGLLGSKTTTVVNMDNEAQIVMSTSVSRDAVNKLGSPLTPADLLKNVNVAVPANTQVLQISCSASSAAGSAECAEAFANSYLDVRQAAAKLKVKGEVQTDQAREKALETQLQSVESSLSTLRAGSADWVAAHSKLSNISSRLTPLRSAIASLGASNNYQAGYIITRAINPSAPSSPRKLLYGPSGLMAGLVIGLGLAFLADRRDDGVHAPGDLERFLGLPVLSSLGRRPAEFRHSLASPKAPYGRAFTELARVLAAELGEGDHTILVAGSPDATLVGTNLAAALARTQSDVLLVLTGSQAPAAPLVARLGADRGQGLAATNAGGSTVSDAARPFPGVRGLRVIAASGMADLLDDLPSDQSKRLAVEFHASARYVVIATEASDGGDLVGLAEFASTALIVAEVGRTRRAEITDWLRRLRQMRTAVLGAVVLPPSGRGRRADRRSGEADQAYRAPREDSQRDSGLRDVLPQEPHGRDAGRRTVEATLQPKAKGRSEPLAASAVREPPMTSSSSSFLDEFNRRARAQAEQSAPEAAPRTAGQTWPMPRVLLPDDSDEPGSATAGYKSGRAKDEN